MSKLNIFVSSTCYDLSQVRANMNDFITQSGHNAILSDTIHFPVSTELTALENCIKNVKENADILVLIVGNRYGSLTDSGKSITNIEFLTAMGKKIPIYCFVDKRVLNALAFWQHNKGADFTHIVDNTKIFEFVEDIRITKNLWVFDFEHSAEIIETLKVQLSGLFKGSLKVKKMLDYHVEDFFKFNLSEHCLKILLEKEKYYEIEFLAQSLIDEMSKNEFLKNDLEYSILVEPQYFVEELEELAKWGSQKLTSQLAIMRNLNSLFPVIEKFVGEPGIASDIKGIYYSSVKYSEIYKQLLNWMIEVKSSHIDESFSDVKIHLADMMKDVVQELWEYPFRMKRDLDSLKQQSLLGNKVTVFDMTIRVGINEEADKKFHECLAEIRKNMERSQSS